MNPLPTRFSAQDLFFLVPLSVLGLFVGIRGIQHLGYVGQDFNYHVQILFSFPGGYSFSLTNPPGLYWFSNLIRHAVPGPMGFPAIAGAFLLLNAAALWVIYALLWQSIALVPLRYAASAFATFLPCRLIQSVVFASDAFTIPVFVLAALFCLQLVQNPRRRFSWLGLGLTLSLGMFCKYTFIGVLPAIAVVLASALLKHLEKAERWRWGAVGCVILALPAGIFYYETHQGDPLTKHWLAQGEPAVMRWQDILGLKRSDAAIFSAPEYYRDEVYGYRKFSYAALLHLSALTDCQSFFQAPSAEIAAGAKVERPAEFRHPRSDGAQTLMAWATRWNLPFSVLALAGTLVCGALSLPSLLRARPWLSDATVVLTLLALGFYAPIFLSLHRVGDPYQAGYWVPRLVLPALLTFYLLGFVLVDLLCLRLKPSRGRDLFLHGFAAYTLAGCALFVSFLV